VPRTSVSSAWGPGVVLTALLFAAACSHSPVAPSSTTDRATPRLPPAFSGPPIGVWKGTFHLTGCSTVFPIAADECVNSFVFRAMAVGSTYDGSLEFNGLPSVDVTGERRADGAVTFTGERLGPTYAESIRVNQLVLKTDVVTGLQGTFDAATGSVDLTHHVTGTVLSASLIRSLEDSVNGTYRGLARMRSCAGTCPPLGAESLPVEFTIAQNNLHTVAGFMKAAPDRLVVPLSGSVSGPTLTLAGQLPLQVPGEATGVVRIDALTVTIDPLGRVRGGYVYVEDYRTPLLAHVQSTWQVDLVSVVRDVN
jgi:hypothetical protein